MVAGRYSALCKAKSIRKADPLPRRPARGSLQSATSSMARGPPPSTSPTPFPPSLLTSGLWSVNKKTLIRNPSIRKTVVKVFLDFHHSAVMLAEAGAPDRPCISSSGGRAGRRASVAVPRQMSATIPTRHNPNICHNPNFTDNARPLLSATPLPQENDDDSWILIKFVVPIISISKSVFPPLRRPVPGAPAHLPRARWVQGHA